MSVVALLVALAASLGLRIPSIASGPQCRAVSLTTKLNAGDSFKRKVDGLWFEIRATNEKANCDGWFFVLQDAAGHDLIYPVNPPLRFNPSQILGCSYGLTLRQGLEMKRSMRFILTEQAYRRLDPLVRDALWPADSPDPDHAAEKYLKALAAVRTGLVRIETSHFEVSKDGMVRSAEFRVELVAPADFHFNPAFKPHPTACPARSAQ